MEFNTKKLRETFRKTLEKDADDLGKQAKDGDTTGSLIAQLKEKYGQEVSHGDIGIAESSDNVWFDVRFIDPHGRVADLLDNVYGDEGAWNGKSFCQQVRTAGVDTDKLDTLAAKYKENVAALVKTANEETFAALQRAADSINTHIAAAATAAEARRKLAEERAKEAERLTKRPDVDAVAVKHGLKKIKPGGSS